MNIGDKVRIRPAGALEFTITAIEADGRCIIEPAAAAPGSYPFPMRPGDLMPA